MAIMAFGHSDLHEQFSFDTKNIWQITKYGDANLLAFNNGNPSVVISDGERKQIEKWRCPNCMSYGNKMSANKKGNIWNHTLECEVCFTIWPLNQKGD